jgi:hypothetical protein
MDTEDNIEHLTIHISKEDFFTTSINPDLFRYTNIDLGCNLH